MDWTIEEARRRFSQEIASWPNGTYESDAYVDSDPVGNRDIHVHVAITVDGDKLIVDFAGSDDRPELNAWSTFGNTRGYTVAQLASLVDPTIPKNEGFFDCIELRAPLGTCVNPVEGKPVSAGTHHPGVEVGDAIALAMAQILPDRCAPQTYKFGSPRQMWGDDPRTGKPFFDHGGEVSAGWVNAVKGVDGWGGNAAAFGNGIKASAEINEALFPHILRGRNYLTDSGGAGKWRGGCGSHFVKEVRTPTAVNLYVVNQRHTHPGIAGRQQRFARPRHARAGDRTRAARRSDRGRVSARDGRAARLRLRRRGRLGRAAGAQSASGARGRVGRVRLDRGCTPRLWSRDHGLPRRHEPRDRCRCDRPPPHRAAFRARMTNAPGYRIGMDVGGTFTDCVLLKDDGSIVLEKAPTTPGDQSEGVLAGLARLADAEGLASVDELLLRTATIVHGTTTADNTMIQMSGASTGLLVTQGFRDEIEMRRCYREDIWDPAYPPPPPIARRRVRLEIPERMTAEGEVETPLDEEAVRRATRRLRAFGVKSVAIVFLHSYLNPAHELRARELVLDEYPDVELVSLSHEVYAKPPEFERTSTTLVNAYVGPPIVRYLSRLVDRLAAHGYDRELLVATSAGGVATPAAIGRRAVATIGSGPAGGVVAAARAARAAGLGDVVSVDMGGTSYDICLVRGGRAELKSDWNWRHRYCISVPMVDIAAIGAGGGSIAKMVGSALAVGPESAGSEPGPACYARGGTKPTVTDANLVLGRLDPDAFWGGRLRLDIGAARRALHELGRELGLDVEETAAAVVEIIDAHMTDAIRRVLSLAGADPRQLDLVAFGGMGGLHAVAHAAALGMRRVLVPRAAPGFSALGLLTADHVVDDARTYLSPWRVVDLDRLNALADDLHARARAEFAIAGVPSERMRFEWMLNLVYPGQTFDNAILLKRSVGAGITLADVEACVEEFHRRNEEARLIEARSQEPMVRGVRLAATGLVDQPAELVLERTTTTPSPLGHRRVCVGARWHDAVPVYDGHSLRPGPVVPGPALVQYRFTTLVLRPGDQVRVLPNGDALVDVAPQTPPT